MQAAELRGAGRVPVHESWIDDTGTPVAAFLKLRAAARAQRGADGSNGGAPGAPGGARGASGAGGSGGGVPGVPGEPAFLLESADYGRVGRYSFIGYRPRKVLRWSLGDPGDPYALLAAELERARATNADGLPPFAGGAVGMFAFDLVRTVEPLGEPNPDPLGLPDLAVMLTDTLVAFDHLKRTVTVVAHPDDAPDEAHAKIAAVRRALSGPLPGPAGPAAGGPVSGGAASSGPTASRPVSGGAASGRPVSGGAASGRSAAEFRSNLTRAQFEANVARIIEYVRAGDAYQVVPSQRWSAAVPVSAFSIYRGLRAVNPSPYMYFLDFGDFQIAGASPEPLVTVSGRRVSSRPIAGTRPRGLSADQDERIAAELLADPKERAEHMMLVDLARNDLGRVAQYGSVSVDELMSVENYSHVMHIVSGVSATLRGGVGALDALRAVLPAGTLSGAPKFRAMQIIDELEPVKRGSYGGAIGWAGYNGDLDTCIHIRTVVVKDGVAHVQAGGGTVADAIPANEYEESVAKSRAVLAAIDTACAQDGWE